MDTGHITGTASEAQRLLTLPSQLKYPAPNNAPGEGMLCITGTVCGAQQLLPLLHLQQRQQLPGPCRGGVQEG